MPLEHAKQLLHVVLVSPNDVQVERERASRVIEEINGGVGDVLGLDLQLFRWETDAYPGFHAEGPQGIIDPILRIESSDIVVGIFWKRLGTPTRNAQSGTAHEIARAVKRWRSKGRPQIMIYFSQVAYSPQTKAEIEQWQNLIEFRDGMPKEALWWPFNGADDFEPTLRRHLANFLKRKYGSPPAKPRSTRSRTVSEDISESHETMTESPESPLQAKGIQVFEHDDDALQRVLDLAMSPRATRVVFLSSGVGSRTSLVKRLVGASKHVELYYQDPVTAPDRTDAQRIAERIAELKDHLMQVQSKGTWSLAPHAPPSSIRAILVYDNAKRSFAAQVGWYAYLRKPRHQDTVTEGDVRVEGLQNPSLVVTADREDRRILLSFLESVAEAVRNGVDPSRIARSKPHVI